MSVRKQALGYPWAVPLIGGAALLASSVLLIPRNVEVSEALDHRAQARAAAAIAPPAPPVPAPPELATMIAGASPQAIAQAVGQLRARGVTVGTAQVVHDLAKAGRTQAAIDYLESSADAGSPALWRIRHDLTRRLGRTAQADALIAAAARAGSAVAPRDIVEAAYAANRPDLLVTAAEQGAIPAPDAELALDLARRFETSGQIAMIARLDAVSKAPWRQADPWLAMRLAQRGGDRAAALRYAMLLPAGQREAAREAIVRGQGDKGALRALLMERAGRPGADHGAIAEQLLAAGFRDDAMAVLERGAAKLPPRHKLSQRLLYLMGPRPAARETAWLAARALAQREWIDPYVDRVPPREALALLARHPLGDRADMQMMRLSIARSAGEDDAARALFRALLDQPDLTGEQLRALSAAAPDRLDPALARRLTDRRMQAGIGSGQDAMAMAWTAWNAGDAATAGTLVGGYLRRNPDDPAALRLMAYVARKEKGEGAARPWRERALASTPPGTREQAELLESLGRLPEALAVVDRLIATRPADRTLTMFKARLLIANGQPGRARKLLQS